jgi:MFS family permease
VPEPIVNYRLFFRTTITNFFFWGGLNLFVLLPLYVKQQGGTEVEIGVVMGLYSAAGILSQPLIGMWVDAVGRRPFMVAGVGTALATAVVLASAPSHPILVVGLLRLLQGIGFSAFFVANYTLVLDLVPVERRGWALGIYGVSGLIAMALAPLAGEWVIRRFGFRTFFGLSAVLLVVALGLVLWITRRRRRPRVAVAGLPRLRDVAAEALRLHMALAAFFGLGNGALFTFMPTFGEALGIRTLALFYTAYAGSAMLVRVIGGRLIDTRGRRAVIVPSMLAQASATGVLASLGLLAEAGSQVPVLPFLFLTGLMAGGAHGFLYPGLAALVTDVTPEARRATVVGIFSAVFLAGNALGAFVFGYLAHGVGYGPMWFSLTLLLLVGFLLSVRLEPGGEPLRNEVPSS